MDFGIGSVVGAGMGMLMAGHEDKRQLKQQQKLQDMQIKGAKEMSEFERGQQMQTWNDTNYGAQKEHMKKANLNPGLMYGTGGGQGGTVGGTTGMMPSGGSAEGGSNKMRAVMDMAQMSANLNLTKAQTENVEADTNKKNGIDTDEGQQRINESLQREYGQQLTNYIRYSGMEDELTAIKFGAQKLIGESNHANADGAVAHATQEARQSAIKSEATLKIVEIATKRSEGTLNYAKIKEISAKISQGLEGLENERRGQDISRENMEELTTTMLYQAGISAGTNLVGDIVDIYKFKGAQKNTPAGKTETTRTNNNGKGSSTTIKKTAYYK